MASADDGEVKVVSPIRRTAEELEEKSSLLKAFGALPKTSTTNFRKIPLFCEEEKFTEIFLRCLICRELYNQDSRPAKLFPCHHSLCLVCILKLYKAELQYRLSVTPEITPSLVTIICPVCQKHFFISDEDGLKQLPTDHRVVQLVDFVKHTDVQTIRYCLKHKQQPLNFFCEYCSELVCRDCTIIDHKEASGHSVIDFEGAVLKYTPIFNKAMSEIEDERVGLNEKKVVCDQAVETMQKSEKELVGKIRDTFARLKESLEVREKELVDMAENSVDSEKNKIKDKVDLIETRCKELEEQYQELKSVEEGKDIQKLHETHEKFNNYKARELVNIGDVESCSKTKFVFNDRDENLLSTRIQNFGEVYTQVEATPQRLSSSSNSSVISSPSSSTYGSSTYSKYGSSSYRPSSYTSTPSYGGYGGYSTRSYYRP